MSWLASEKPAPSVSSDCSTFSRFSAASVNRWPAGVVK